MTGLSVTAAQSQILTAQQQHPRSTAHNVSLVVDVTGPIDVDRLADAIRRTVAHAEALHVRFRVGEDGTLLQVPAPGDAWSLEVVDLRDVADPEAAAQAWMDRDLGTVVDVTGADALFAHALLLLADDHTVWYQRYHQALVDGHGIALLVADTAARYTDPDPDPDRASAAPEWALRDLVDADLDYRGSARFAADRDYWLAEVLQSAEPLQLCAGGPASASAPPESTTVHLDAGIADALSAFAADVGIRRSRLPMALLVAYLHRVTGLRELTVSVPIAARIGTAMRRIPGAVSTILPVTFHVDPDATVGELARAIDVRLVAALRHGRYRGEDLEREVRAIDPDRRVFGPGINSLMFDHPVTLGEAVARVRDLSTGPVRDLDFSIQGGQDGEPIRIDLRAPAGQRVELLRHQDRLVHFLSQFFADPVATVAALDPTTDDDRHPALVPMEASGPAPLAPSQRLHWLRHRAAGRSARADHALALQLAGAVDRKHLSRALDDVVERHAPLRTVFASDGGEVFASDGPRPRLEVIDIGDDDLQRRVHGLAQLRIDLTEEAPLRLHLVCDDAGHRVLLLTMHHLAADDRSMRLLLADLLSAYASRSRGARPEWAPLEVGYPDFARWQARLLGDPADPESRHARQLDYWRNRLSGMVTRLHLPAPAGVREPRRETVRVDIGAALRDGVDRLAGRVGVDTFTVMQAALATILTRHGAGNDIPIGALVTGREEEVLDGLVGCFSNIVILRTDTSGSPRFDELLARVQASNREALGHRHVGFGWVAAELGGRVGTRYPQVMLVHDERPGTDRTGGLDGVVEGFLPVSVGMPSAELTLAFRESAGAGPVRAYFEFSTGVLDRDTVERWAREIPALLEVVTGDTARS
ncbi:condensation domain-containing protein [Prescottella defluvii]|uniref:condensation domain-containing protein n=1 Tax=Prescottella defluvii TaxID=1323361 RepID=UPI0004F2B2DA|nr:condensation domain-containing protein [Prescottella defluvii]